MSSSTNLKSLLEPIYELQYTFGDPRPHFMKYLLSLPNTETYFQQDPNKALISTFFIYQCTQNKKRLLSIQNKEVRRVFEALIMFGEKPFVIIPVLIRSKRTCDEEPDDSRHIMYVIYNRFTDEIERIDLKKHHLQGFPMKMFYNAIMPNFGGKISAIVEKDIDVVPDHDVKFQFMDKLKSDSDKYCYPLFLISYLNLRTLYPNDTSDDIYKRVHKLSPKKIIEYWQEYVQFYNKTASFKKCKDGKIRNLETTRCIDIMKNKNFLLEKPVKQCARGKYFNMFTNKCVTKDKLFDINIALEEALGMRVNKDDEVDHLGGYLTIPATNFVISKHGNAFLIHPGTESTKEVKERYAILHFWNYETQKHDFSVPKGYWELFKKGMESPHRFIITLISLNNKPNKNGDHIHHANALIYDKSTNELERFDGLGADIADSFNIEDMDKQIEKMYDEKEGSAFPKGYKYFTPIKYCPKNIKVFQLREMNEISSDNLGGNCAVWRLWYIDARLANPHLTRDEVAKYAMMKLEDFGSVSKFIKSYQAYINMNIRKEKYKGKQCPEGKVINLKTGRCIKAPSK